MSKKLDKYVKERKEILDKLLNILEIDDKKHYFTLEEINENKKEKICNMEREIKKYYVVSNWFCFRKSTEESKKWLSILRHLIKDNGGIITNKKKIIKNGETKEIITHFYVILD